MVSDFATTLKALRLAAGLSQEALARRARVSKPYVALMESGRRLPHPDVVAQLDMELHADGRLVALAQCQRDQRQSVDDVNRRDVLKAVTLGSAEISTRRRAGQADLDLLLARTARLRKLDDTLGGADTYALYRREMRTTHTVISVSGYTERVGKGLLSVLAEQAQLAGWAAFDAGWNAEASALFGRSHTWARAAAHSALTANALALMAYQKAFNGRPDVDLADASRVALDEATPQRVRALVSERAAWTYAVVHRAGESERALDKARDALGQTGDTPSPAWTDWIDDTELQIMTGRCRAALNDAADAVGPLVRALAGFPDEYARDKALYLLALARAHAVAGEVEEATTTVVHAAGLAAGVRSCRPAAHIADVEAVLVQRYGTAPAVSAMRERLADLRQLATVD